MSKIKPITSSFVCLSSAFCLLLSVFLITGCSKSQAPVRQKASNAKVEEEDLYKIAVVAPQFGPYQELGLSIIRGAELAVDVKNKQGGIHGMEVKLIKVDDGGLAGEGAWKARDLVSEMVLGVIGHLNSDISIPASEVYSKAMIVEISPGSTSPFFTEREPVRGYVFRTVGRDDQQSKIAARFVADKKFKEVAILYNNKIYGQSLSSSFVKEVKGFSPETNITYYKMYKIGKTNFSKEIQELKIQTPELVFFVGEYGDAAKFLKQLRESGIESTFLGSEGVFDPEFLEIAQKSSEGAFLISLPGMSDSKFIELYKEKYNKDLGAYSANSYDATNILLSAIEKVKEKNPGKIAKVVKETKNYKGLTGSISFDPKGDLVDPRFSIYLVKEGKFAEVD